MNGEHHGSGERDRCDDPNSEFKTLDELSREEILRALAGLDQQIRAESEDTYSFLAKGMLHSRLGDDRRAVEEFTRVIELEPDNAVARYSLGASLAKLGDLGRAVTDFDRAIALDPANPIFHHYRGLAHRELGEFDRAIALEPGDADSWYERGDGPHGAGPVPRGGRGPGSSR